MVKTTALIIARNLVTQTCRLNKKIKFQEKKNHHFDNDDCNGGRSLSNQNNQGHVNHELIMLWVVNTVIISSNEA